MRARELPAPNGLPRVVRAMRNLIAPILLAGGLAGCGDGGSTPTGQTPTPTPPVANGPPSFTSGTSASVIENTTLAYQATVSDPNNDPISLTISGGADAAKFAVDAMGRVSFVRAPNFDLPEDSDGDNVYALTLRASDGQAAVTRDILISVTNSKEGLAVKRIASGFASPIQIWQTPHSDSEIYVAEKSGRIYRLNVVTGQRWLELTIPNLSTNGERGLIGLTTGPRDAGGGLAAFVVATASDGTVQLIRYLLDAATGAFVTPATATVLLTVPHSTYSNHNGGWIEFGPDGLLYMGVGDGGGNGDPDNNAQNPHSRLGKILRLAPGAGGWGPAPGNPFASGGGDPYVFALGLRNPFRAAFEGNDLIIGDVGEGAREEIDIISTSGAGANLGWPFLEGTQPFRGTAPGGLVAPLLQYIHGSGPRQGASVIGGLVHHGTNIGLDGYYIFADFVSKHIWAVPYARLKTGPLLDGAGFELKDADFAPDAGTIDSPVAFGRDRAGRTYLVDLDGEIFRLDPEMGTL